MLVTGQHISTVAFVKSIITALLSQEPLENPLHKIHSELSEGNILLLNEKKKMTHYVHQLCIVHFKAIKTNLSKSQVIFNHEFIPVPLLTQREDVRCFKKKKTKKQEIKFRAQAS